jgi:hypothetical protein
MKEKKKKRVNNETARMNQRPYNFVETISAVHQACLGKDTQDIPP